jgi:hypothetical protein
MAPGKTPDGPYDVTNRASHRHQREPASHIGLVRELCYHTLYDAEVPIQHTVQEAAVVLQNNKW